MTEKYYYALWIPVYKDTNFSEIIEPSLHNMHDNWKCGGYYINGRIDKVSLDFTFSYRPHRLLFPLGKKKSITLKCEQRNRKGFLLYSCDIDSIKENDGFISSFKGRMNPSIYHYIKGCFHRHEFHSDSTDALLQPFVEGRPLSLRQDQKEILLYYIEQYKEKFHDFLRYNEPKYKKAIHNIDSSFHIKKGIDTLENIIIEGNEIKGELKYCKFLITCGKQQSWISKDLKNEIDSSCEGIENLLAHASNAYNLCTAGLGVKYGRWGIAFGLAGIFVSIGCSLFSIVSEPNFTPIFQKMDSVTKSVTEHIDQRLDERTVEPTNDSIAIQQSGKTLSAE